MYSVTLCSANVNPARSRTAAKLSADPVMKLSMQTTSAPCSSRNSQRCEPMNPAPPVTRTLMVPAPFFTQRRQGDEKGPDARRRRKAAREAYSVYVERAADGANEADGPLSSPWQDGFAADG